MTREIDLVASVSLQRTANTMRYFTSPLFPAGIMLCVVSALTMTGCPTGAPLEGDPSGDGPACDIQELFLRCGSAGCHEGSEPPGNIDLISPGVENRLLNVPAKYENVRDPENCPQEPELLLDPNDLEASLMLTKLNGSFACGDPMPQGLPLKANEIDCVRQWLQGIVSGGNNSGSGGGSGEDNGGTDTGSGGSAEGDVQ